MLVSLAELIADATEKRYALGAVNSANLETTLGIIRAAVDANAPVIIQINEDDIAYAGLKPITHIVETIAKNAAVNVPVALHLDHGKSFRSVAECIHAGFSSIMIDAADLPFDENVTLTRQAVSYAHERGAWAQGSIGRILRSDDTVGQLEPEKFLTDPEEAKTFVKSTGVDTLGISIGNVHGIAKMRLKRQPWDIALLARIHEVIPETPLVLHGTSGVDGETIRKAREAGARVFNFDTEIRLAFTDTLRATLAAHEEFYDIRDALEPSIGAVQRVVREKIALLGAEGAGAHFTPHRSPS